MFRRRGGYRRIESTVRVADGHEEQATTQEDDRSRFASEISSSLTLQILIYHNVLLSIVYFFVEGGLAVEKVRSQQRSLGVYIIIASSSYSVSLPHPCCSCFL